MAAPSIPADRAAWRPQVPRPTGSLRAVVDPIIEPLWQGLHVLAHVGDGRARLIDEGGEEVSGQFRVLVEAIGHDVASEEAVLDGWVTNQATRSGEGLALITVEPPRGVGLLRPPKPGPPRVAPHDRPEVLAFVAVDLLVLDGEALLDLPLLERKRLLDSVVVASELVRSSPYVRPPLDRWLPSWQAVGFHGAVLKAANGRYVPGASADDWLVALPHPRR